MSDLFTVSVSKHQAILSYYKVVHLNICTSKWLYFLIISSVTINFGSLGIYAVERETPGSTIKNIGDAFWFSFTTLTTTGYGDVYPITAEGRIISGILISIGIAVILGFCVSLRSYIDADKRKIQK